MTEDDEPLGDKLHGQVDADTDSVEDVREIREDEMLPDEREVIAERIDSLDEGEFLTLEEVADELEMDPENPDLEDALDGLIAAANYCDDVGLHELALEVGGLYQRLGEEAPEEDRE